MVDATDRQRSLLTQDKPPSASCVACSPPSRSAFRSPISTRPVSKSGCPARMVCRWRDAAPSRPRPTVRRYAAARPSPRRAPTGSLAGYGPDAGAAARASISEPVGQRRRPMWAACFRASAWATTSSFGAARPSWRWKSWSASTICPVCAPPRRDSWKPSGSPFCSTHASSSGASNWCRSCRRSAGPITWIRPPTRPRPPP